MLHNWLVLLPLALIVTFSCLQGVRLNAHIIKTQTFLSPSFTSTPGSVVEKFYYNINFPKGHIALKSFDAEVVDEAGKSVPLFDAYLHHWTTLRYFQHKNSVDPNPNLPFTQLPEPDFIISGNNGVCQRHALPQFYGMGTESRKTSTFLPHPYGIEVGNSSVSQRPLEYEEKWALNVHVIDTRGVEDRLGCVECRCDLYNVPLEKLSDHYIGGFRCCYDKTQCRLKQSYEGREERILYVKYTVKWVDWDDFVIPVKNYIFDATDTWNPLIDSTGLSQEHHKCLIEYDVESCSLTKNPNGECKATKRSKVMIPDGGFLIYGVAHQHIGGIGATLYGQDGRVLCSSTPIYGGGYEIGNENGYVVGMSTCYSHLDNVKIDNGEIMTLVSNYDSTQNHTGVMGLFQIMVAQKISKSQPLRMEALKVGKVTM